MRRGIIISDTHCGGVGGLTPPGFMTDEYRGMQMKFWNWYLQQLERYGPYDFLIGVGDFTDGEGKKGTLSTLITDVRKQALAAEECLLATEVPAEKMYLVRGTPLHTNGNSEYEDKIADDLGCAIADVQRLEIEGWKIHTRHVVGRSDTPYGQATPLLKELARLEHEAFIDSKEAPDVVIRGHVHYSRYVGANGRLSIASPALMLPIDSANGRRYAAWDYTVGLGVLELEEGIEPLYRAVKMDAKLFHDGAYRCVKW